MEEKLIQIIWLLALTLAMVIKGLVYIYKKVTNKDNPISPSDLYREFKDFKESQEKWNEKIEKKLGIWNRR